MTHMSVNFVNLQIISLDIYQIWKKLKNVRDKRQIIGEKGSKCKYVK